VHEKQKRESRLDDCHRQHAEKHLGRADILIGDEELDPGQG